MIGVGRALRWGLSHWHVLALALALGVAATMIRHARAEARDLARWAETACDATGTPFAAQGKAKRGEACHARLVHLVAFERDALTSSNQVLAQAASDHTARAGADVAADSADRAHAAAATLTMEKSDAAIGKDDRVGGDWFAALNRVGGLRPPPGDR